MSLRKQYGTSEEAGHAGIVTIQNDLVGDTRPALLVLLAAVGLLLLIACANVGIFFWRAGFAAEGDCDPGGDGRRARATDTPVSHRKPDTRTRGRLVRRATGVPGAANPDVDAGRNHGVSPRNWTACAAVQRGNLHGIGADFRIVARVAGGGLELNGVLKDGGRGSSSAAAGRVRGLLVASEVAIAAVLLVGAGLLLRSFNRLLAVPEGFDPSHVLTLQVSLPNTAYPQAAGGPALSARR